MSQPSSIDNDTRQEIADGLRRWASGSRTCEAAVMILTEGCRGHLVDAMTGCLGSDLERGVWFPFWDDMPTASQAMSSGERRLIALAVSLGSGIPVDLQDACVGLDDDNAAVVGQAIAHAVQWRR